MNSRIYLGRLHHDRRHPSRHAFSYRVFLMYLDLAELPQLFDPRWLWSARGPAFAWFRRRDHLGHPDVPLATAVRDLVERRTGSRPAGAIRLLTHLRYAGYCMNPVSFYYCFDTAGELEHVVAEVHNTPWGERHCYVLDRRSARPVGARLRFDFAKEFHVSPFMPLQQDYQWQFSVPGDVLDVTMHTREDDRHVFSAGMSLRAVPVSGPNLARVLANYPFMTAQVILAIYWQALRLWLRRTPFYPHPKHYRASGAER